MSTARAQPPPEPSGTGVVERVEVRVVEVEVVVTDRQGRPVPGLGRDDLELRVDGEPRAIDYFTAYRLGRPEDAAVGESSAPAPGGAAAPEARRDLYLAVVWDVQGTTGAQHERALDALGEELAGLLPLVGGVMVARIGERLEVVEPLTLDPERIRAALSALGADLGALARRAERRSLISEIERAERPIFDQEGVLVNPVTEGEAATLYASVMQQADIDRQRQLARLDRLGALVRALGGLPGRKHVLYLGSGLDVTPGATAHRLWLRKYPVFADRFAFGREDADFATLGISPELRRLAAEAAARRVVLHTMDPGGSRPSRGGADVATFEASELLGGETRRQLDFLAALAVGSGGHAQLGRSDVSDWLGEIRGGLELYYSIGFDAPPGDGELDVRVIPRDRSLRARHWRRATSTAGEPLQRLALATLIAGRVDNPLRVQVEVRPLEPLAPSEAGAPRAVGVLPISVRVPIAELTLLPEGARHVASLELVVIARSEDGALSLPFSAVVPLAIENRQLLLAAAREAEIPLRLAVGPGGQELALVIHDAVGRRTSTLLVSASDRTVPAAPGAGGSDPDGARER